MLKRILIFVLTSTFSTIPFLDVPSVDAAALVGYAPKITLNIHLDQQLEQNQTEAKPDLSPQQQPQPVVPPSPATNSSHTNKSQNGPTAFEIMKQTFARQDVGQEVGDRVGTIISGVLGGGIENVFTGSSSFIGNQAAAEEVNFVLHNVAPPLESVLKFGFNGLKAVLGVGVTTPKTVVVTQPPEERVFLQPVVFENGTVQYIPIYHKVTKPPLVLTVTNPAPPSEDNDSALLREIEEVGDKEFSNGLEDENERDRNQVLEKTRVDRLHLH